MGTRYQFEEVLVNAEQLIIDAASLPVSERLRVAQAIWDSLPENAVPTPSSESKSEFDRRMENYRRNPETAMTLDELRCRLHADRNE
jgi:putative addiction module component (TIGR02574 family)